MDDEKKWLMDLISKIKIEEYITTMCEDEDSESGFIFYGDGGGDYEIACSRVSDNKFIFDFIKYSTDQINLATKFLKKNEIKKQDYFSIAEYAKTKGINLYFPDVARLGMEANKLSQERNIETRKAPDEIFREIRTFRIDILKEVFKGEKNDTKREGRIK